MIMHSQALALASIIQGAASFHSPAAFWSAVPPVRQCVSGSGMNFKRNFKNTGSRASSPADSSECGLLKTTGGFNECKMHLWL